MNFFRRAIRYCLRQKLRSVILLSVFTLLSSAALIALSVGNATAEETEDVKQTVGASIRVEIDADNADLYGSGSESEWGAAYQYNGDYITQEVIDAIAKVEGVVSYSAESEEGYYGAAVDFDYFPGAFNVNVSGHGQSVPYTVTMNTALSVEFLNGTYTLEEGRHIRPDDCFSVLISKELADKNDLSVGDNITLYSMDTGREDTFKIVGIFSGTEGMSKEAVMSDGIPANKGYIDMKGYQKMWNETDLELGSLDVYINSAEDAENILKIIKNLNEVKGKTFVYSIDRENFDLISAPLSSLQTMVDTAVVIIAFTGAAIIVLLLALWTRGRKKEAAVLMAVGRSKTEIILQFLAENIFIAIPSAALSLGLTALSADKVGSYLVGQTAADSVGLRVIIHFEDIAAVYGAGVLILISAVLSAAATIIRLIPREILSQMN